MYLNKSPEELVAEFIAPFEDHLTVVFIGDNLTQEIPIEFKKYINKLRTTIPGIIDDPNYIQASISSLYRGKVNDTLKNNTCLVYFDTNLSHSVINYLTNTPNDELDDMLINKFLIQVPQEKYIFNISKVNDESLAKLLSNMDTRYDAYNYLILGDYLAIWILYTDEFSLIQTL